MNLTINKTTLFRVIFCCFLYKNMHVLHIKIIAPCNSYLWYRTEHAGRYSCNTLINYSVPEINGF